MALHSIFDEADVQNFGIGILPNHEMVVHIFPEVMIADISIITIARVNKSKAVPYLLMK